MNISNVKVYDLEESVIACRNAMRLSLPEYNQEEFEASLERAKKLCQASKGEVRCHANFRTGIRVSFDIEYPNYISPEMQRYHWFDIVTSSSKMHRIMQMDFDKCCNKYVTEATKDQMKQLVQEYNDDKSEENFMRVLSNCPQGVMLFMRISTNYEQLRTIYLQRKNHKLPEWRSFCQWIESLPYAQELIVCS
ncbi:hypothetical protein E7747_11215 [Duncaniella dubosii]|jgi:hypothetical protein|uniref:Uncharacterized protein n=1 Tax=Duncaniella dubosii TaxID=2518971 RepID=A0A4P7W447_9BACT|nr:MULTISPECIES: hypothetical protein [Duncaniella]QCD42803.1 hypothetical protein E7747_11215 [Duncaniella dubosii]ROS83525.1 hypothetical protein EEK90_07760 [Muribaculaceae bacterium Isolate-036 (Harlan)]ROS93092.1 hypothetical protein EEL36_05025 [Muribaculaceae bacterium Isolate-043 (Harlan)]